MDVHISLITKNKPNACSCCIVLLSAPRGSYRNAGKFKLFCLTSSDHFDISVDFKQYISQIYSSSQEIRWISDVMVGGAPPAGGDQECRLKSKNRWL